MAGAGGGFEGAIGGEATTGAAAAGRDGSGALAAGFTARVSFSVPLRLPNTTLLHAGA